MATTKHHPGCIENRGAYLRVILQHAGQRHSYRLDSLDRKAAEKFAREQMRTLEAEQDAVEKAAAEKAASDNPDAVETRFSALLAQYEREELPTLSPGTQRSYRDSFLPIRDYFVTELGDPTLDSIKQKHIKGYLAWRRTQRRVGKGQPANTAPISNRTLQKDRAVLHRLFDVADQLELREGNPVARVEHPKADPRTPVLLSAGEFEKLLTECEPRPQLWLYALTLAETGGRCVSEALHLRWEDVDLAEGFIEIRSGDDGHRTKSGKSRYVPMTPRLLAAMKEHFARCRLVTYHDKRTEWIFHHERDRRGRVAGERVKAMRTAFDSAAKAAGIPDTFHRHDLRHRRVTTWLAEGKNPVHVKEALGHSDLRTTMHYTHLSKEHLRSLVEPSSPAAAEKRSQNVPSVAG